MSFLNAAQRRSRKRQMAYVEFLNRARTEDLTKDQIKAIEKKEKEKKETEERRRNEKRKRANDVPNVEFELDFNGRRIGAPRAKLISLETARTD
jgi:chaperone required for assembly of F1-ATPase